MTEHELTKTDAGCTIEVPAPLGNLSVVWTLTVERYTLIVRCHTIGRDGEPNEDGLAVLPVDAETVRLEAM